MTPLLRTVVIFCVITLGSALGAQMHQQVQKHDASLRTPGQMADRYIWHKFLECRKTDNPDRCALASGITI